MAESESAASRSDGRPALVRYVGKALLFSVEDIGTGATVTYVGVRLDAISGEYYPFSALRKRLVEHNIVEIVGLATTSENDHPRLSLEVSQESTGIDEKVLCRRE